MVMFNSYVKLPEGIIINWNLYSFFSGRLGVFYEISPKWGDFNPEVNRGFNGTLHL